MSELSLFLRQQSRPLKLATLSTLIALVRSNAGSMTPDLFEVSGANMCVGVSYVTGERGGVFECEERGGA